MTSLLLVVFKKLPHAVQSYKARAEAGSRAAKEPQLRADARAWSPKFGIGAAFSAPNPCIAHILIQFTKKYVYDTLQK